MVRENNSPFFDLQWGGQTVKQRDSWKFHVR